IRRNRMDPYKEKIETVTNEYDANLENGLSLSLIQEKL
ncbi:hypothetical protein A5865_002854, partial [Enterococcus sp. 12E11_DIV0728]